jgi:hypothetical protein
MSGWKMDNPMNTGDFINIVSKQKALNFAPEKSLRIPTPITGCWG